jgi:hypothetical protein
MGWAEEPVKPVQRALFAAVQPVATRRVHEPVEGDFPLSAQFPSGNARRLAFLAGVSIAWLPDKM